MTTSTVSNTASLLAGLKKAQAGDTIKLSPGTYAGLNVNGLRRAGVVIASVDLAKPAKIQEMVIAGSSGFTFQDLELTVAHDDPSFAVKVTKSDHLNFLRLKVHGSLDGNPQNDGGGLQITDCSAITMEHMDFTDLYRAYVATRVSGLTSRYLTAHKIQTDAYDHAQCDHVLLEHVGGTDFRPAQGDHCDLIQFWSKGMTAPSHDIIIRGAWFVQGSGAAAQGVFMRDESGGLPYDNVLIEDCFIASELQNGISVDHASNLTIRNNKLGGFPGLNKDCHIRWSRIATAPVVTGNEANGWPAPWYRAKAPPGNTVTKPYADAAAAQAAHAAWSALHP